MKKSVLAVLAALSLAACGGGEKKTEQPQAGSAPAANAEAAATDTLNIYNWSNYVDESTVEDFKKANKLKLTYDLYENNETLEAKMLTGKSGYDLVVPGIAFLPRQIEAGAYQKINKDLISPASTLWQLQQRAKNFWAASCLKTVGICCSSLNTPTS